MFNASAPATEALNMHSPLEAPAQVHKDAAALPLCTNTARSNADSLNRGLNQGACDRGNTIPLLKRCATSRHINMENVHDALSEICKCGILDSMIPFLQIKKNVFSSA